MRKSAPKMPEKREFLVKKRKKKKKPTTTEMLGCHFAQAYL